MQKRNKFEVVILILVLSLSANLWAAGTGEETPGAATGKELVASPGKLPIVSQQITLTLGMAQNSFVQEYKDNEFTKWLEQQTNIALDFMLLPEANAGDKIQIMIASGDDLPDVLVGFGFSNADVLRYAAQKAIMPLDEYIDEYGFWMLQMFAREESQNLRQQMTAADGHIYSVSGYEKNLNAEVAPRVFIYTPWLDALGREMPTTTDEFYDVLKAFKTQDPNDNGKADEIPYAGAARGWATQPYDFLINSFIQNDTQTRFILKDGKLTVAYIQDEWRDALSYVNRLTEEGLLSPLSFTQDRAQLQQMATYPDVPILGSFHSGSFSGALARDNPRSPDYDPLPPLEGPSGVRLSAFIPRPPTNAYNITRSCENPAAAFRLGDFLLSEEASMWSRYGKPGRDWVPAPEGATNAFLGPAKFKMINFIWTSVQSTHWQSAPPRYAPDFLTPEENTKKPTGEAIDLGDPSSAVSKVWLSIAAHRQYLPASVVYPIKLNLAESEEIAETASSIRTYVTESIARFCTGDLDIDTQWESYLGELDKIGLEQYLEIYGAAYTRTMVK